MTEIRLAGTSSIYWQLVATERHMSDGDADDDDDDGGGHFVSPITLSGSTGGQMSISNC